MSAAFFSILRLESAFPRPVGDSSNPQTHSFAVRVVVVDQANVERVVYYGAQGLVPSFIQKAKQQIGLGAIAVGTSCGFLFEHQDEIQSQIDVPFVSSSLTMLATDLAQPVAVLSFDAEVLSQALFFKKASSSIKKILTGGIPKIGHLFTVIARNQSELDLRVAESEVVRSALDLVEKCIETFGTPPATFLIECTNLGVYKTAIKESFDDHRYQCKLIDYNDVIADCWNALQKRIL
jgi:hypothetical protein